MYLMRKSEEKLWWRKAKLSHKTVESKKIMLKDQSSQTNQQVLASNFDLPSTLTYQNLQSQNSAEETQMPNTASLPIKLRRNRLNSSLRSVTIQVDLKDCPASLNYPNDLEYFMLNQLTNST